MESMPQVRRVKINGAEQKSASHAKGRAVIMMVDRPLVTLGLEKISTERDSL
jgi:hypothetical protein